MSDEAWRLEAECRGTADDPRWMSASTLVARELRKEFCDQCPVYYECLMFAIDTNEQYGIWAGMTIRQRRVFARRQRERNERSAS